MYAPNYHQYAERLRIYRYRDEFGAADAYALKNELLAETAEQLFIDLSDVTKVDLIAINALAMAHKYKNLKVVMPKSAQGRHTFHITKFDLIFNIITSIPDYLYDYE
jgi:anti-anti-sigma regulatory factor